MIDTQDPEYQLRWPRGLLARELRELLSSQGFSLIDAIDLLFEEALAGRQPRDDLADALRRDQEAALDSQGPEDEYPITRTVTFVEEVLAAVDQLPALQSRRYWADRRRPERQPRPGDRDALQLGWQGLMSVLVGSGYLDRAAGDDCPDTSGPSRDTRIRDLLGGRAGLDGHLWIGTEEPWRQLVDDNDFYTLVEVMHDLVARPRTAWHHGHCDQRHYQHYSRATGQELYRSQVNELFDRYQIGLELAGEGEDAGLLVRTAQDGRQELIAAAVDRPGNEGDAVRHAVALFRDRDTTVEHKRSACIALAGVLEARRALIKAELLSGDEGALFQIANQFAIRHQKADQRRDYDEAYLDWLYWWYLATIELTDRLVARSATADRA